MIEAADSISTFAVNAEAGGAVAGSDAGLACGPEQPQLQRVESADAAPALGCSRAPESGKSRGVCVRSIGVC